MRCVFCVTALTAVAFCHWDDHHQTPFSGPHKQLWYNALPGDGGTQVNTVHLSSSVNTADMPQGRFRLLWYLHIWTVTILPLPRQRRPEIRHCVLRYVPQ